MYKVLQPSVLLSWSMLPVRVRFSRSSGSSQDDTVPARRAGDKVAEHEKQRVEYDATADYDLIAVQHGWLCLCPLMLGLPIYYLQHHHYKSWYSWLVTSLVDFIYLFGFLALTPQIYINYRLQSVAHLPMKPFLYKIFNTFVDDVFAFVVRMPLKHKIMTLRDDVIFMGFLYQWFIYRTDKSRANEFGFLYDQEGEGSEAEAEATKGEQQIEDTTRSE